MWVDGRVNGREPPERPSPEGPRKSGSVVCMLLLLAEGVLAALGAGGGGLEASRLPVRSLYRA